LHLLHPDVDAGHPLVNAAAEAAGRGATLASRPVGTASPSFVDPAYATGRSTSRAAA
jgi:hypothetical protein